MIESGNRRPDITPGSNRGADPQVKPQVGRFGELAWWTP
jgi:hypothetical protein